MRSQLTLAGLLFGVAASTSACTDPARTAVTPFVPTVISAVNGESSVLPATSGPVVTSASDDGPGSLRQVVAHAKVGQRVTFRLGRKNLIELTSGAIAINSNISISGPGATSLSISALGKSQIFTVGAHASVTLSGLTLSRGHATQGGAIYNSGKLTLEKDAFTFNVASGTGAVASRLRILQPPFDPRPRRHQRALRHPRAPMVPEPNGTVSGSGGAVYNSAHATLNINNVTFKNNTAPLGGVIDNEGIITVANGLFANNSGLKGGAKAVAYGYGGSIYNKGKLAVTSSTFTGNVVGGKSRASYGAGGAIAQFGGSATITESAFASNVAGGGSDGSWGNGGAIYVGAGTLVLGSDTFTSNAAGGDSFGYGGAVYADLHFGGSKNTFTRNAAVGDGDAGTASGGAIYAGGGLALTATSFSANAATAGSSSENGYASGGAIDVESAATLTSVVLTTNTASGGLGGEAQGGGVYLGGGAGSTWKDVRFISDVASASGPNSYASGGAVCAFGSLAILGTSELKSDSAIAAGRGVIGAEGGGIAVEGGPLSFTGTVSGNSATTQGGGFWLDDFATITNSYAFGNVVNAVQHANDGGGAVYVALNGNLTMTGSTLAKNATHGATSDTGGGGLFNSGAASIVNSTITENSSSVDGGGVENIATGGLTITNTTLYINSAAVTGGSLKNLYHDAALTITNSIVADGMAGGQPNDVSNDGGVTSGDYNVITSWGGNPMSGSTANNLQVEPELSALSNNGGPTPTNADGINSPGTGRIPFNNCLSVSVIDDQRGFARGITRPGQCDIGAFENQTP